MPTGSSVGGATSVTVATGAETATASNLFTVTPGAGQNAVKWNANAPTDNVTAYKLYAATGPGGTFGSASLIWTGLATSHVDTGITSTGTRTYFLIAENVVGDSPHTAGVDGTTTTPLTGPLETLSNSVSVETDTKSMNFTGSGVAATSDGSGHVTVAITGASGSTGFSFNVGGRMLDNENLGSCLWPVDMVFSNPDPKSIVISQIPPVNVAIMRSRTVQSRS